MTKINYPMLNRTVVVYFCSVTVIFAALGVLAGWAADIPFLQSVLPNYPKMKPNTAVGLCVGGIGLFLAIRRGADSSRRYASIFCGIFTILLGSLTLIEYIAGSNLGIDTLLVTASDRQIEGRWAGRMPPHAAFNFVMLGTSLVFVNGRRRLQRLSEIFAFLVIVTAFAALLGHLYGSEQLYGISKFNSMAVHAAGLFLLCSIGLLAANRNSRTVSLLASESLGGSAARRLLPAVILIPTTLGWLRISGQQAGLYDTGFGAAMTVFFLIVLMFSIIYYYSEKLHRLDLRRRQVEKESAVEEQRYRNLFDHSQGLICIHDIRGMLTTVNPAVVSLLGFSNTEMVGKNFRDFIPEKHHLEFDAQMRQVEHEGMSTGYLPLIAKNGKKIVLQYRNVLVSESEMEPYVLGHAQDVTELLGAQKELKNLSLTDDLTGLYNRRGFLTMAEQQIKLERHEGTARGLNLMFADLDGLKKINDMYGHEAGSDSIIEFSKVVKTVLRSADLVARWGGDEFVILTIGSKDEHISVMSRRINEKLDEYNAASGKPYTLACSIGVAPVPTDGIRTLESIIAEADEAMYTEKRRRKEKSSVMMR